MAFSAPFLCLYSLSVFAFVGGLVICNRRSCDWPPFSTSKCTNVLELIIAEALEPPQSLHDPLLGFAVRCVAFDRADDNYN